MKLRKKPMIVYILSTLIFIGLLVLCSAYKIESDLIALGMGVALLASIISAYAALASEKELNPSPLDTDENGK